MIWKDFIPQWMRFPLILLIIVVFMFSGGVYMSAVAEMSGSLSWITEDIMMAGYASMTGLTIAFPLLFRILYRFPPRELLLFSCGVFIVSDYLCMVSDFLPLLVFLSFISGFFKIVSTFVCWNNVQLKITPKRDFTVFFPYLFTFVLGSVQLANIATGYSIIAFDWQAMHRLTIGAFLVMFALIYFGMRRHYRQGPYIPFKGIDYLGGTLWSLWLICIVFICVYGEYYGWLDSEEIWTTIVFAVILLTLCLYRAATIRHPYISLGTFRQHNMLYIFLLFVHLYVSFVNAALLRCQMKEFLIVELHAQPFGQHFAQHMSATAVFTRYRYDKMRCFLSNGNRHRHRRSNPSVQETVVRTDKMHNRTDQQGSSHCTFAHTFNGFEKNQ